MITDMRKETIFSFKPTLTQYGSRKVINIKRRDLLIIFCILCVVTPFTNWLLPFSSKIIRKDFRHITFKGEVV